MVRYILKEEPEMNEWINAYLDMWRNYANFNGRCRRAGYWKAAVVNFVVIFIISILPIVGSALSSLYSIAILVPSIALCARRLHDIHKSGWWYLINLIPLVGQIIFIVWMATDSKPETNQWGPSPKYATAEPVAAEPVAAPAIVEEPVAPAAIVEEPVAPAGIVDESAE